MKTLNTLFGNSARARMLRVFFLHPEQSFNRGDIAKLLRVQPARVGRELNTLLKTGVIAKAKAKGKGSSTSYVLNKKFPYKETFTELLTDPAIISEYDILYELRYAGSPKLVVLSGVFVNGWDPGLDLLIVADRMNKKDLAYVMRVMESDLGTEIRYTLLTTEEYKYRKSVKDRLIRDIFDYPHHVLVDRING